MGLLTALWLLYFLTKKSPGGAFCLLEIRAKDGNRPTLGQLLARSAFPYALGTMYLFPPTVLPTDTSILFSVLLVLLIGMSLVIGIVTLIIGTSLIDRLSQTMVLELKLPDHLKPKAFTKRIF